MAARNGKGNAPGLFFVAVVSFAISVLGFWGASDRDRGIPRYADLSEVTGHVTWSKWTRWRFSLRLDDAEREYVYISKQGAHGALHRLIAGSPAPVTLLYDGRGKKFRIWQIELGGKMVRSFQDIVDDWRFNNTIGLWLGFVFLAIGTYLAVAGIRALSGSE